MSILRHDSVVAVSGFPRCGSSLLMRMLAAGGVPLVADNTNSCEHWRVARLPGDGEWVAGCVGRAVKFLDPHRWTPPEGPRYALVWLDRDETEQARSQVKFLAALGHPVPKAAFHKIRASLVRDRPKALVTWRGLTGHRFGLTFEALIADPAGASRAISDFLGGDLDVGAMAPLVRKRGPECSLVPAELRRRR